MKVHWKPCGTCGDENGPTWSKLTPQRIDGKSVVDFMYDTEVQAWEASGRAPLCARCHNRFRARKLRCNRIAAGQTSDRREVKWRA